MGDLRESLQDGAAPSRGGEAARWACLGVTTHDRGY